jgi:hypothetical protein
MPVATQQMNNINLDLLRAGVRGKPNMKIHYYCMPHWPGQIPDNWRRLFYGALGHGMQVVNLFEFRPVQVAYTENHCSNPETYRTVLRSFRELGLFEDIIQSGRKRPAKAALWFSETADIWGDNHGSFAAGKRTLYTAVINQGTQLDFVIEGDSLNGYEVLYLADAHVSGQASDAIAKWVKAGGNLLATAGAGMFDELNQPNAVLRKLLNVNQIALDEPENSKVEMVKQDLPFAKAIDEFVLISETIKDGKSEKSTKAVPIFGVRSRLNRNSHNSDIQFKSGTPAIHINKSGKGWSVYMAFLPGLTYYHTATDKIPVDRGTHAGASSHLIPNKFSETLNHLLGNPLFWVSPTVVCSEKLVEANIIDSPKGSVVILTNWSGGPVKGLEVKLPADLAKKKLSTASGASFIRKGRTVTLDLDVADALILR